ncbi:glycoside hydrolase family 55 protein [Bradyrhizobium sp. CCGUVB1N3]|uniref:glycoside hydrolase family 55 protein n=1 Tax=Bradyrhizobium sp. CCGUVB1N3 TaxID=2949629 RepID=UPI0020B3FDE4|nr:glycoside hydrolase family 55 protein [Bradyrhizobium sp. CCGUVB1N3]MCP3472122.1 glycoside hydrolase family 55 protein [Bradyrhizobium sp. CCGUVB1N3]
MSLQEIQGALGIIIFSGVGDGSTDDSAALQSAIDACAAQANGGQVYAPPAGVAYVVDNITLKARVDIIGVGQRPVAFKAKSGSSNPMWRLDTGPVNNCRYENFVCLGSTENPRQNCFELRATPSSKAPYNGGLWWAIFSNISVSGFSGFGMWFRGGVTGIVNAHQFIELRRVTIFRANDTYSRALLLTGQCGQFSIDGECQLDGIAKGTGTNVEIGPEYNNAGVAGGQLVGGSPVGGNAPYNIKFIGCTSQSAETAFYVYNSINILHHGCYFENTQRAIRHVGGTSGSIIENCHFTNAASDGVGGGYCIQGGASCRGSAINNDCAGAADQFFNGASTNSGWYLYGNKLLSTFAVAPVANYTLLKSIVAPSTVVCEGLYAVGVNTEGTVSILSSKLHAGERITVKCAVAGSVVFDENGNLLLGQWSTLVLNRYDTATFEYSDLFSKFVLVGTTGVLRS